MIEFIQLVPWLNHYDTSHLGSANRALLGQVKDPSQTDDVRDKLIEVILKAAGIAAHPLEAAETNVLCAEDRFFRKRYDKAREYLKAAVNLYAKQSTERHRKAIALWMLGIVERELNHYYPVCDHWMEAFNLLDELAKERAANSPLGNQDDKAQWYLKCAGELQVGMVSMPEVVYTWLNEWEPTSLGIELVEICKNITSEVKKGNFRQVNQKIRILAALVSRRTDVTERADAFVECGLAKYELLENLDAIRFLQMAVSSYMPNSHQQAVARWILGVFQMKDPSRFEDGIHSWQRSIETFEWLEEQANWGNDRARVGWYRENLQLMTQAKLQLFNH